MTFDANDAAAGVAGPPREILGWEEFGEAARSLATDVLRSGFQPDVVIAPALDHERADSWIVFPWSALPPVTASATEGAA